MTEVTLLLVGLAVGIALGVLGARSRGAVQVARLEATLAASQAGEARLEQSMRALTFEATAQSQEAVARAVAPLHETLQRYEQRVAELERARVGAYSELRSQLGQVHEASTALRAEAGQLVAALRSPQVRGRWGEHQLRRVVEAAGLLEHCDFAEQVSISGDQGTQRPDLIVQLYGGRRIVVDAKAPLDAYLSAMEARDQRVRDHHLDQHARHLRAHVEALGAKRYWASVEQSPEFVVLFLPADPFLDAALARDATLLEQAFGRNVVLATPATLVALLRTIAYSWRQEALTEHAVEVHRLGRELYTRLASLADHLSKVGSSLSGAVTAYNRAIGSLESRVLVSARRFTDLGVTGEPLPTPAQVELAPRQPQAPELVAPDP
ncbi:DNA recombination protein RmuC [Luedemannella helvata]|uniref:DNA recombination protein RmuC n=1 Tax=Luedemannella helvata TaxID=349315 RepID=A0ABP4VTF1_9ACTN